MCPPENLILVMAIGKKLDENKLPFIHFSPI
jgi:hypothetical protein